MKRWMLMIALGGLCATHGLVFAREAEAKDKEVVLVLEDFESEKCKTEHVDGEDAEGEDAAQPVEPSKMTGTRVALSGKDAGHGYRCAAPGGTTVSWLSFYNVPKDISRFRFVRFRIRGSGAADHKFYVRMVNTSDSIGLESTVQTLAQEWTTVEVRIPDMRAKDDFDPTQVTALELLWFTPPAFSFEFDDLQLVEIKGTGGWRYSEKEMIEETFGKKRVKKVKHIQTEHFDIYTDSAAARRKFPKALEKTYVFARDTLLVPDFKKRLPVYIFQNPTLYFEFCVRSVGWPLKSAQNSAGHGSGRYFATYYQSAKSDVVTHELTHSIFHRTVGGWGGSWFQEGVAVYVEHLAINKSAASEFSTILRKSRHRPLRDFITIDRLLDAHNTRGGSTEAANLYLQAGAFFEFLMRSDVLAPKDEYGRAIAPKEKGLPQVIRDIADADEEGEELAKRVETICGTSIEELEKAWITWGSHPPKLKKR